jgi:hypothetical protein
MTLVSQYSTELEDILAALPQDQAESIRGTIVEVNQVCTRLDDVLDTLSEESRAHYYEYTDNAYAGVQVMHYVLDRIPNSTIFMAVRDELEKAGAGGVVHGKDPKIDCPQLLR